MAKVLIDTIVADNAGGQLRQRMDLSWLDWDASDPPIWGIQLQTRTYLPAEPETPDLDTRNQAIIDAIMALPAASEFEITEADIVPLWNQTRASAMSVAGVLKSDVYTVNASPLVAGGAGVARFYIDSNGDGTGNAPSEVYAASLQVNVIDSANIYQIGAMSVDTGRTYIDITMKQLTGSVSFSDAPNDTVVNCVVSVKK